MDEKILEITKKFHDTYEKLSKEYDYETRKETKVFDITSNNGKLMYATVNEVISPILDENQDLKKQLHEASLTIQEMAEQDIECPSNCEKLRRLEKQLEAYETYFNRFFKINNKTYDGKIVLELLNKKETQQKEFIKWLEDYLKLFDNMDIEEQASYDTIEEILQKYKSIIGVSDEKK